MLVTIIRVIIDLHLHSSDFRLRIVGIFFHLLSLDCHSLFFGVLAHLVEPDQDFLWVLSVIGIARVDEGHLV